MAGIFKAYDIRGIYGTELTEEVAYLIGRAYATYLKPKKVVIGHDMRPHSVPLTDSLSRGLVDQGVEVIQLGLCTTPMSYFANGLLEADGGIIVTASHNPGEYNGFKLCRANAVPMSGESGIGEVERIVNEGGFDEMPEVPGSVSMYDVLPEYREHVRQFAEVKRPLRVAVDYANAMGILEAQTLDGLFETECLFDTYDGTFPNHEANPLDLETFVDLQRLVREGRFDFGIAFDGDADRVGFVDEKGAIVTMDMITGIIAQGMLRKQSGNVFYDLRSSWSIKELIEECGGTPMMSRVGHAFIKNQMREADGLFAGELSGHYYFRENYFAESSALAVIFIANMVSESGKSLSELVAPLKRYFASGEINSTVEDTGAVFERILAAYPDGRRFELDGLSVEFEDWWFNVRMSNTEPLVRLNLEAKEEGMMVEKRDALLGLIRG